MRRLHLFLQLAMAQIPSQLSRSDYEPRAQPCLNLGWASERKAYALYTIPNLKVKYSIQVVHIPGVFPLRVTNYLDNKLYRFLQPEGSEFDRLSGPAAMLRRHAAQAPDQGAHSLLDGTPTQVRPEVAAADAGQGRTSGRAWTPSTQALQNIAAVNTVHKSVSKPARFGHSKPSSRLPWRHTHRLPWRPTGSGCTPLTNSRLRHRGTRSKRLAA